MIYKQNILFTGVTSGIGLCLVFEVVEYLKHRNDIRLCITCRNMKKGEKLKAGIIKCHPSVEVVLIQLDVGSMKSVFQACKEIEKKFESLDCLYLNAGIMPTQGIEWKFVLKEVLINFNIIEMFRTGHGVFKTKHDVNNEGIDNIFATNVLGHFALVQQLLPLLIKNNSAEKENFSRIIWTSSTNANKDDFNVDDITGAKGANAYGNSKYVLEALSWELNQKYNDQKVYSYVCDPGTVYSNITGPMLPFWVWFLLYPFIVLLRFFIPSFTVTPHNACNSLVNVLRLSPARLDPCLRYGSRTHLWKGNYIETFLIDSSESVYIFDQVSLLYEKFRTEYENIVY